MHSRHKVQSSTAWAQHNKHQQTGTVDHSKTRSSRFSRNKTGDGGPISQRVDTSSHTTTRFSNFSLVPYFGWHWPYTSRVHTSHSGGQNSTLLKQLVTDYRQQFGPRSDNRLQARAYQYSLPNPPPSHNSSTGQGKYPGTGNHVPSGQRGHSESPRVARNGGVLLDTISRPEEGRAVQASDQPAESKLPFEDSALQNGRDACSERSLSNPTVDDTSRLKRHTFCDTSPPRAQEVPALSMEDTEFPVQLSPLRPVNRTSCVYKSATSDSGTIAEYAVYGV